MCFTLALVGADTGAHQTSFLEMSTSQIHLRGLQQNTDTLHTPGMPITQFATGSRPAAPQYVDPIPSLGSGTRNTFGVTPGLLSITQSQGNNFNFSQIPPSMYFTSPYDYEADDAANFNTGAKPDTWYERIGKTKNIQGRSYNTVYQGMVPRSGWMGTGIRRPINPLTEALELSDIDPWRQAATQMYAFFRSPARNPEMKGQTLRRLQKSEVLGFDHTNGQYGVPLGSGVRGIGGGVMGLTKTDYGPYGMGPLHPSPLMHAVNDAQRTMVNQIAAPLGANMLLGVPALFV